MGNVMGDGLGLSFCRKERCIEDGLFGGAKGIQIISRTATAPKNTRYVGGCQVVLHHSVVPKKILTYHDSVWAQKGL
jgi:hypothetical protein